MGIWVQVGVRNDRARSLLLAAILGAVILSPLPASALPEFTAWSLDFGSFESFVSVGGADTKYPEGTVFPGLSDTGALSLGNFFIPSVDSGLGDTFVLDMLDGNEIPTDTLLATVFEDGTVETDPFKVSITRMRHSGTIQSAVVDFVLTTGVVHRDQCGETGPLTTSGVPLDFSTGMLTLVGTTCVAELEGEEFNNPLGLKLTGTFDPVPQPVPEPATVLLLGIGLIGVGYASRRNRAR